MSRKKADESHELDPLKGGLTHHPFAALREKLGASEATTAAALEGADAGKLEDSRAAEREAKTSGGSHTERVVTRGRVVMRDGAASTAHTSAPVRMSLRERGADDEQTASGSRERIIVRVERTGRGGKTVTIAEGPALAGLPIEALARDIARGMGTGARAKGDAIIAQGDQRERLVAWLHERSFLGAMTGN